MEIIRLTQEGFAGAIKKAVQTLKTGGLVLFPTDTLYGFAVDAMNTKAIAKLRKLKARHAKKPIAIVVPHHEAVEKYVVHDDRSRELADRHMPGPLTLVLPAHAHMPDELKLNGTLGVRMPSDPFSLALAHAFDGPFTATSASRSGHATASEVRDIIFHLGPDMMHVDLVIDAGPRDSKHSSTVVAVVDGTSYVLREGMITREELGL